MWLTGERQRGRRRDSGAICCAVPTAGRWKDVERAQSLSGNYFLWPVQSSRAPRRPTTVNNKVLKHLKVGTRATRRAQEGVRGVSPACRGRYCLSSSAQTCCGHPVRPLLFLSPVAPAEEEAEEEVVEEEEEEEEELVFGISICKKKKKSTTHETSGDCT